MTTRTQGHNYNGDAGGTGGYINDDGDTGDVQLAISIHRWDTGTQLQWRVTNMGRNDLRAPGGLGGRSAPPN